MNDNKVISLRFAHFSYEKCCGYNLPIPEMIAQFFEYMRGIGPDAFIIKRYRPNEEGTLTTDEIMRGCVPTSANDKKTIRQAQVNLSSELDARAEEAREYISDETSRASQPRQQRHFRTLQRRDHGVRLVRQCAHSQEGAQTSGVHAVCARVDQQVGQHPAYGRMELPSVRKHLQPRRVRKGQ